MGSRGEAENNGEGECQGNNQFTWRGPARRCQASEALEMDFGGIVSSSLIMKMNE